MDPLDRALLDALREDARQSLTGLARRLGVARSTAQARLERLERTGVIAGYSVRLGKAAGPPRIRASVLLSIAPRAQAAVLSRLKAMPEVSRVDTTSGRFDLLIEVAAPDTATLDRVLDAMGELEGVKGSESLIQLSRKIDRPA